jgi:hypothetical protein
MSAVAGAGKQVKFGRSDRSPLGRWFWEIDRVLLLLVAVLISIGLLAVALGSIDTPIITGKATTIHTNWR